MLTYSKFCIQLFEFHKKEVPDDEDEKVTFVETLMTFGVSLQQYTSSLAMEAINM